tara:strand:+ start:10733 stop:11260 length:528 start_codon:yes stop_codon:yes gene_type:complete
MKTIHVQKTLKAPVPHLVVIDEPSNLPLAVQHLNFERLKHKNTQGDESIMTPEDWDLSEREYRRFLALKVIHPDTALVPSKQVDIIWHAHILDTRAYREDCQAMFGRFMDHYPYFGINGEDDYKMLQEVFSETIDLYEAQFGPYPNKNPLNASRCEDHSCHAPSSCACRSSGACK